MEREPKRATIGLCAECRFARRIRSARGSEFVLCGRSEADPDYPRYPRLPVDSCAAYEVIEKRND
ncbi:MAG: hypothetical protein ACREQQ_04460 [Candidatus Binatia bacterium]